MPAMLRFRRPMIAAGCQGGDTPRRDPRVKMVQGVVPSGWDLASRPAISRPESMAGPCALPRAGSATMDLCCASFRKVPRRMVLDGDDAFAAAQAGRRLRLFKAHHDGYGFRQIVVFDSEGRFVSAGGGVMMRLAFWFGAALVVAASILLANSTEMQSALGATAASIVRPIAIPLVELINVPAFVYCAATLILLAGFAACAIYQFAALRPSLQRLRRLRSALGDLPQPRVAGPATVQAWTEAHHALGLLLQRDGVFVAGWSAFQAEALRERGVPGRPFSSFVAAEPSDAVEPGSSMRSLPGYFTSVGLILTFVGLVVALYFAAKGFRSGDNAQAKLAIIQLLNAASFKFLTSVSALISAFLVSLYGRYGASVIERERQRTLERIEGYLASWRERVGAGRGADALAPADLLRRFDALLATVAGLATDVKLLAERNAGVRPATRNA